MPDQDPVVTPTELPSEPAPAVQPPALGPAPLPPEGPDWKRKRWLVDGVIAAMVVVIAGGAWYVGRQSVPGAGEQAAVRPQASTTPAAVPAAARLELIAGKHYGDKYANGLLPVGDGKYSTSGAQKGRIYVCQANFVPAGQAGAQTRGPWFVNGNTQYDIRKKATIAGNVSWTPSMHMAVVGGKRTITTNDLPSHTTGTFPVGASDPARVYDANPSAIQAQSLTYTLDAAPTAGNPSCVGGEVGVMLTGVALFDGFDAGGRDAGAWEVQDGCDGHPQNKGEYHYHTLSRCITTATADQVIGFALDGFPITGPKVSEGNILTTDDLDECHGITSEVSLDGQKVKMYHYVMTQDFPYSVSCFRGTAVKAPGLPEGGAAGSESMGGSGTGSSGAGGPGLLTHPPILTPPPRPTPPRL